MVSPQLSEKLVRSCEVVAVSIEEVGGSCDRFGEDELVLVSITAVI